LLRADRKAGNTVSSDEELRHICAVAAFFNMSDRRGIQEGHAA